MPADPNEGFELRPDQPEQDDRRKCPHCSAPLATNAVLCVQCGYHLETGQSVSSRASANKPKSRPTPEPSKDRNTADGWSFGKILTTLALIGCLVGVVAVSLAIFTGESPDQNGSETSLSGTSPTGSQYGPDDWLESYAAFQAYCKIQPDGRDRWRYETPNLDSREFQWEATFAGIEHSSIELDLSPPLPEAFQIRFGCATTDVPRWRSVPEGSRVRFTGKFSPYVMQVVRAARGSSGNRPSVQLSASLRLEELLDGEIKPDPREVREAEIIVATYQAREQYNSGQDVSDRPDIIVSELAAALDPQSTREGSLLRDISPSSRGALLLIQLKGADAAEIVPAIIPFLTEKDKELGTYSPQKASSREQAVRTLGDIGPAAHDAVDPLLKITFEETYELALLAAGAIRKIAGDAKNTEIVFALIENRRIAWNNKQEHPLIEVAKQVVGRVNDDALPRLLETLTSPSDRHPHQKAVAALALGQMPEHAETAVPALRESKDAGLARIVALGELGPAAGEAHPEILQIALVQSSNALGMLNLFSTSRRSFYRPVEAVNARDSCEICIAALRSIDEALTHKLLLDNFRSTTGDDRERAAAAYCLGILAANPGEIIESIQNAFNSPPVQGDKTSFQAAMLLALGELKESGGPAVPFLLSTLEEDHLKFWAVKALGRIGPSASAAEDELKDLLSDNDSQATAAMALIQIGTHLDAAVHVLAQVDSSSWWDTNRYDMLQSCYACPQTDQLTTHIKTSLKDEHTTSEAKSAFKYFLEGAGR